MPIPSPFHPRTSKLCTSLRWTDWAGYHSVSSYDTSHESEYFALRHAAGLIDVTPLFKYEVKGPEAGGFLDRIMTREISRLEVGQAAYSCWCDGRGKIIDDGTVLRLGREHFRVTAAEPMLAWFSRHRHHHRVTLEDSTDRIAVVAVQGPTSREILGQVCDLDLDGLGYFRVGQGLLEGREVCLSRTGYTGDLGYEVWVENEGALPVWDALMAAGKAYNLQPAGLEALDNVRLEAGYIMNGVDFFSAHQCLTEARQSTPLELGLGWLVDLEREPFVGRLALQAEKARGPKKSLVGLEMDWEELAALYEREGLPAQVSGRAWRTGVPVYDLRGRWIGKATSGSWSPILKKNLALAQVEPAHSAPGTKIKLEWTVEYRRHQVTAEVVARPFYDPERKKG